MVQDRAVERRLAAILAADVAAYSRLMHCDEEGTHAKLTALLTSAVNPAIAEHGGRVVKNTGDGFLAEFPSAVKAVRAAVQFQARIKEITTSETEEERIAFRVGINIGDVIVEQHDIFGDGVNIAARLESIAEPGGICISSAAYDQVRGKVGVEFADLGEHSLKNIGRPVRAYAMSGNGSGPARLIDAIKPDSPSPPRLSIVVLPFANLSGDPGEDYFVDGVTESLTTDLSRVSGSFVIGRHTAFAYRERTADLKQIGHELNVRYVVEGSVQRNGARLRVNVQLINAAKGSYLWADRFEKPFANLFDMQDEIVSQLANALNAQLVGAEARRAERLVNPDAMDLVFQGIDFWNKGSTIGHLTQARAFFERALAIDPENVEALVGVGGLDTMCASLYLVDDPEARFATAEKNLLDALSLTPQHAQAHMFLGAIQLSTNRPSQGISECERALALNRNLAEAHSCIGAAKMLIGRSEETEAHVVEALRLSPRDDGAHRWMNYVGVAKLMLGADAEAVAWLGKSLETNRNYVISHFQLAAAFALLGSIDEAHLAVRAGLLLDPTFSIRKARGTILSEDPVFRAGSRRIRDGMRLAGVPEG